jgi:hypothetical protein
MRHLARQRKNKKKQGSGIYREAAIMSSFLGRLLFPVEKPAGPMRKRSLHYTEDPGKNISPRTLNFPQIHHKTHSRERK